MNYFQEAINMQWMSNFGDKMPNQRFFKPISIFWETLKSLEVQAFVDCGCGNGDLILEAQEHKVRMAGCDISMREGTPMGLVQIIPAHKMPFSENLIALVCRPDHGGWCEDLILHCLSLGSKLIYVGLPSNIPVDLPLVMKGVVLADNVGVDGETMILFS